MITDPRAVHQIAMPAICSGWNERAKALELPKKGEKRERDREAYMQGVLATLVALGIYDQGHADRIGFLCAVGRLPAWMDERASAYVAPTEVV
jgi:hypothetical protein